MSDVIDGRWKVQHQISYQGKADCTDIRCSRRSDVPGCMGHHCHLCVAPTSMYGHCASGRYVDGDFRRFADGHSAFSCQPGFEDIPLEPAEGKAA